MQPVQPIPTGEAQADRVDTYLRQLHEWEQQRRQVASSGPNPNHGEHNRLANAIRNTVADMHPGDVRSMALRMVTHGVNGDLWPRCDGCGRPTYLGEARRNTDVG